MHISILGDFLLGFIKGCESILLYILFGGVGGVGGVGGKR